MLFAIAETSRSIILHLKWLWLKASSKCIVVYTCLNTSRKLEHSHWVLPTTSFFSHFQIDWILMACVRQNWWPCFPRADRTHSLWHRFEKTDHLKQNSTVKQSWDWRKLASAQLPVKTSRIDKQLSAHLRKSSIEAPQQHISLSASRVPQLYNQRLSPPPPPYTWKLPCA